MLRLLNILVAFVLVRPVGVEQRHRRKAIRSGPSRLMLPFGPGKRHRRSRARTVGDRLPRAGTSRWSSKTAPGGDGLVSINAFACANDDHTLLWMPVGISRCIPSIRLRLPYDANRDLLPIVNVTALSLSASGFPPR